ncbi:MAG: hypothetical protein PHX61_02355 [Alphaproteobacteria bacterium]|nr:hypothetical protein [Alphaproteobacteria bacterium]
MTKLGEIELKTLAHVLVLVCGIIAIVFLMYNAGHSAGVSEAQATHTPIATLAPTPTPAPTPAYPSVLTYTVLSMTTSTGHYQVTTTAGQILYCSDYADWNSHNLQDTYTSSITGMDSSAYLISNPVLIAQHYSYINYRDSYYYDSVRYYNYNGQYWQCDWNTCDQVTWKQARGQHIYYGKPPQYSSYDQFGSGNPDRSIAYGSGNPWQGY